MRTSNSIVRLGRRPLGLDVVVNIAFERGGRCLSDHYINARTKLRWQCANGHQWSTSLSSVKHGGHWCPICAGTERLSLDIATQVASRRGGECLSTHYVNTCNKLIWRCSEGHTWKASLNQVKDAGTWCPHCSRLANRLDISVATTIASKWGGLCLSTTYHNSGAPLRWKCARGHEWIASLSYVKNRGRWCVECSHKTRLSIDVARTIAASHQGVCLSTHYVSIFTPMRWRCANGHLWDVALKNVRHAGAWCPRCSSGKSEREIQNMFETIFSGHSFPKTRPDFLLFGKKRRLELDGYCVSLRLAFEYNGAQHYNPENYFNRGNKSRFSEQVERDSQKVARCQAIGVRLVVVPYTVKDRWSFVRLCLLQWFAIAAIFPMALAP